MDADSAARFIRAMLTRELLDQAVRCLAVSPEPLDERLDRCSVPLAGLLRAHLETEEELALWARVQLGLAQLRAAIGEAPGDERGAGERLPVFALEATASHVVDLRDATTRRMLRAARRGPRRRRTSAARLRPRG